MKVIKDNSKSIDIVCLRCGSVLSAKEGEIFADGTETCIKEIYSSSKIITVKYKTRFISQCPCCLNKNAKVLFVEEQKIQKNLAEREKELRDNEEFLKQLREYMH